TQKKSENKQDEVNEQIEVINVDDKDQSIIDKFFNFVLFEREQELSFR
ncbi:35401_t:CDS:1, partial [Gigaspora margarita]